MGRWELQYHFDAQNILSWTRGPWEDMYLTKVRHDIRVWHRMTSFPYDGFQGQRFKGSSLGELRRLLEEQTELYGPYSHPTFCPGLGGYLTVVPFLVKDEVDVDTK